MNPDPGELITPVGSTHRLLLNKFCVYRPMLLLPTVDFALQSDDLNFHDVNAAFAILKAFKTKQLMIFNCGVNAGSSQGHKHMQIFPAPSHELWPSGATSSEGKA